MAQAYRTTNEIRMYSGGSLLAYEYIALVHVLVMALDGK